MRNSSEIRKEKAKESIAQDITKDYRVKRENVDEKDDEKDKEEDVDEKMVIPEEPSKKKSVIIPSFPFDFDHRAKFEEVKKRQKRLLFPNEADGRFCKRPKIPWTDMLLISRINLKHAQANLFGDLQPSMLADLAIAATQPMQCAFSQRTDTLTSERHLSLEYESTEKMKSLSKAEEQVLTIELETVAKLKKKKIIKKPRGWLMVPMPLYACGAKMPAGDMVQMEPPFTL